VPGLELRFRVTSPELLTLPWRAPLAEWDASAVAFRDLPVGPSRHLVRFVEADRRLWALKELPRTVALHEYEVLRATEDAGLPAVRPAGVVIQPLADTALLVTHYLVGSWQYRRLLMRMPSTMRSQRARLLDGIASLLVELHRRGVYWGDCSLANTLFTRDGQTIQAWLVDAETAQVRPLLSAGQRYHDLEIAVENVFGGLLDVAARLEETRDVEQQLTDEAQGLATKYDELWHILHEEPIVDPADGTAIGARINLLNELGFEVEEIRLGPVGAEDERLRLTLEVARHQFHSEQLRALTGLDVGEGQAVILLSDLRAHHAQLELASGRPVSEFAAARSWFENVLSPGIASAHAAVGGEGSPTQAYCDLLEVRWLLSERAGRDVGDEPALDALRRRLPPSGSAADLRIVDLPTEEIPRIEPRSGPSQPLRSPATS
jgi:transposase